MSNSFYLFIHSVTLVYCYQIYAASIFCEIYFYCCRACVSSLVLLLNIVSFLIFDCCVEDASVLQLMSDVCQDDITPLLSAHTVEINRVVQFLDRCVDKFYEVHCSYKMLMQR